MLGCRKQGGEWEGVEMKIVGEGRWWGKGEDHIGSVVPWISLGILF